ncbi:MAG: Stk1 family PASTA domain-containing Ser/Thr kinase [Lachnospiraceae bacterium]|nr:Stk1 family PASTA domain-containing Ser/Thr kinase [Lachnospiraceae bacterium]
MLNIGDILDSRYEIQAKVGQGGMSHVYRARDLKMGRDVAIKVLKEEFSDNPDFVEKFNNEARSAARLTHSNIVAAYDTVDSDDMHYIVMELVEGITLKNYIARKTKLSNKETIGIAIQAAEGIAEAHRKGIIHRDIKPQNIIISKDGKVKVADFGIAKAASADSMNQAVIGSAHYIAPEQAKTGEADARSDLYSLGITMYEMITGRLPYDGENTVDIVMAHLQNVMVPPAVYNHEIYPALSDIITRATRKDPEERYQSAEELIDDLRHASVEPEGHFVKLYDTVSSGELGKDGNKPSSGQEAVRPESGSSEAGKDEVSMTPFADGETEEGAAEGFSLLNILNNRFALAGLTLAVVAVIALAGVIAGKTIVGKQQAAANVTVESAESTSAEESESQTETESEADYTLSIQGEELVPDLTGMTVNEARAKLAGKQVSMDSSNTAYSDEYEAGTVINQSPVAGEVLVQDATVYVTISLGPESNQVLSNLKNLTIDDATASLNRVGIGVSAEPRLEFSEDVAENYMIGYEEMPTGEAYGSQTAADQDEIGGFSRYIRLIVSRGKSGDYIVMPQLVGLTQGAAEELIVNSGLLVGGRTAVNTAEYEPGYVLSQSAAAEDFIKKGTPVNIQITVDPAQQIAEGTVLPPAAQETVADSGSTQATGALSDEYYYGSIDDVCTIGDASSGPGESQEVYVAVRLMQRVEDYVEYTMIDEPRPVSMGSRVPVTYHNIRGAYGVDTGEIQVYNVNTDAVYRTFTISFNPID